MRRAGVPVPPTEAGDDDTGDDDDADDDEADDDVETSGEACQCRQADGLPSQSAAALALPVLLALLGLRRR